MFNINSQSKKKTILIILNLKIINPLFIIKNIKKTIRNNNNSKTITYINTID